MKRLPIPLLLLALMLSFGCKKKEMSVFPAHFPRLIWQGRTYEDTDGIKYMIGSASSLTFRFAGSSCNIWLQNAAPGTDYNYISLIVDGVRQPRRAIRYDTLTPLKIIPAKTAPFHEVELYKETEATCGQIMISKIEADSVLTVPQTARKRIEFIGNSITVGMSSDESLVPCGAGTRYDQHNAYDAYGPRVARALNMQYMISGFSGIGICRNSIADRPVMLDVYPSTFLSPDPRSPRWDFTTQIPDIVSICLGTNDFSSGEGATPRSPFDPIKFNSSYVYFLKMIHGYYPDAHIVITNTPMLRQEDNKILMHCLEEIKSKAESEGITPISIFTFSKMYSHGCYGHPNVEEQRKMAEEMILFLKEIIK